MVAYIIFIVFIIFIVRYILSLTTPFSSAISFGIKEKERIALRNILSLSKISLERFNQLCNVNVGFKNISAKLKIVGIPMPGLDDYLDVNNTNGTVLIRRNKTIINIESGGNQCFSGDLILTFPQDTGINYNFSKAISFDGVDDYVEVPNSFLLNPNSTVTVEAWIYPISYGGGGLGRVVSKETGIKANPYALELRNTSAPYLNGVIFCVGNGASETCTDTGCNNIITLNTWQHVAGRYNTTHLSVFVNGVEKCNRALSSYNFQQPNTSLLIGNNPDNTRQFKGIIDEVRIYNRALSEDEIRAHYNNGIGN
ncbi:MAG: LamG domain-containing protein, partial [Candidatus Nanoarchaeia archaeon]|nr:LamG domain-containing protein [Candidatus Jingweiarchaeum tengchongense]